MDFRFIDPAGPEYQAERMLRWEVLAKPLGLPPGSEALPDDEKSWHLLAFDKKKIVGCVCFLPEAEAEGRIFQMAVSEEYRGKGFGRQLLIALERSLVKKGIRNVYLFTPLETEEFYAQLGYVPEGERFVEKGHPHLRMHKTLAEHSSQ